MKRFVLAAAIAALSFPALAGEGLICEGEGIKTHFPMAGGVGFHFLGAVIDVNGKVWSTDPAQGIPIMPAEAFSGEYRIEIDFSDQNAEQVVAMIRLFWAEEESDPVYGGLLHIPGEGAWPITCGWG
jgi:hypothetical protein